MRFHLQAGWALHGPLQLLSSIHLDPGHLHVTAGILRSFVIVVTSDPCHSTPTLPLMTLPELRVLFSLTRLLQNSTTSRLKQKTDY